MNKKTFLFAITFVFTLAVFGQDIKLMTYNIRLDTPKNAENEWTHRKETLVNQILFYGPDIMGIQEGLEHQVQYLNDHLENYKYVGVGRSDVKEKGVGEYSAIYYNVNKFKKLKSGTFWLSNTPDKASRGWDASLNRICTYIFMKDKKSGEKFWVFNTHFDHKGVIAREKSTQLIVKKIQTINKDGLPVFLMGDFNLKPDEEPIQYLANQLNDARTISLLPPFGPIGTFNGFDTCKKVDKRIDYIFVSKENIEVKKYAVIASVNELKYPSDHFPVFIEAEIKK